METMRTCEYNGGAMNQRHITRFTYEFTNFQGWRVAISRQGMTLARYFSDKQYGDAALAREQAELFRDAVLEELRLHPNHTREILDKYRAQAKPVYPAGLKPCQVPQEPEAAEQKVGACSMRSNKVMQGVLKGVCRRFQLDTASVLKLSLYLFALQYSEPPDVSKGLVPPVRSVAAKVSMEPDEALATDLYLQRMIEELESRARLAGLPSFEEFSTGRTRALPISYAPTELMPGTDSICG